MKQATSTAAPKGQAKQAASGTAPKGQAKQAASGTAPKGQAKQAASVAAPKGPPNSAVGSTVQEGQAKPPVNAVSVSATKRAAKRAVESQSSRSTPRVPIQAPDERTPPSPVHADSESDAEPREPPSAREARKPAPPSLATAHEDSANDSQEVPAAPQARKHTRPPLSAGALDADVLPVSALEPVRGTFMGAPLLLHTNPETIRTSGVIGSTMGRVVPGKSEGGYTFSGQARLFLRAVNRVGESFTEDAHGRRVQDSLPEGPQRCSLVVRNTSGRPIHLEIQGGLFSKYLTPQFPRDARGEPFTPHQQEPLDEDFTGLVSSEHGKVPDPRGLFFRGPSAVLAAGLMDSHLDSRPAQEREAHPLLRDDLDLSQLESVRLGTRGSFEGRLTVKPGATALVLEARQEKGGTLCALVNFTAVDAKGQVDPGARFRLATVSSPRSLSADELAAIAKGEHPLATSGDSESLLTIAAFPPLQGVLEAGSTFVGGRTLRLSRGDVDGDLVMSSLSPGHAGPAADVGVLTPTSRSEATKTPRTCDGGRGVSYELAYTLENPAPEPCEVELLLTSPRLHPQEQFFPQAGVLNLAMRVDGERVDVRVNQRGEGRVLAVLELPPEGRRQVRLEWTHVGGTFPPAGLEWRVRR
ncbi:hypothetical protein [Myxococcus stipitatus]|uniref:hypothetical protein n=1 Tax=Myxococcus stipitatus TaxID=83455 RepID=UPI0005C5D3A4|nr:hypothetical protein [Myxococcus stipitatus]